MCGARTVPRCGAESKLSAWRCTRSRRSVRAVGVPRPTGGGGMTATARVPVHRDRENDYTREAAEARREFVREHTGTDLEHVSSYSFDPGTLGGNIEQFVGVA